MAAPWAALSLAVIAILPLTFTVVDHGDCYGAGPVVLDAVAWPDADDWGDCCADLRTRPAGTLARALLGTEVLWFLFAPVAVGFARILGWIRARAATAVIASVVALHLATLALGERSIGSAFMTIGVAAGMLAPFTYGPAWAVAAGFARADPRAGAHARIPTRRRWAVLAAALAALGVPAWLFLVVAHDPPEAAQRAVPAARSGCSGG